MYQVLNSYVFFSLLFLGSMACSKEQASPEACVEAYAQLVNQGKLEEAKELCTPAGQAFLIALGGVISASDAAPDSTKIVIKSIQCHQGSTGSLYCITLEDDGFEEYEKTYWLIQQEDKWLIDQPSAKGTLQKSEEKLEAEE